MAGSSESEEYISVSSDNFSPDARRININNSKKKDINSKKYDPNSIVISDTELEEGEISDEVDGKKVIKEKIIIKKNPSPVLSDINSDTNSPKRKLNEEDFTPEVSKRGKYDEQDAVGESFEWSELRVLLAGDERVVNLNWEEWVDFPEQDLYHVTHCNLESLCNLAEKHLFKDYDIVIMVGFHYDFVSLNDISNDDVNNKLALDLKTDVNIFEILKTVNKFHNKWERQYPNTYFVWTLPSPPDFLKYNLFSTREKNINSEKRIDKRVQNELTKNYYDLTKKFLKEWKAKIKKIPIFPLNKVLFVKKHCYKRSFEGSGTARFPRGYLKDGFYPTKMMTMYFAYLFIEYLIDSKFYPENKFGLDIKSSEKKLVEIEPLFKNYLHNSDRSNGHSRRRSKYSSRHQSHRSRRKDGSVSPRNSNRSRSRSRSRRRPKSRQKYTRTRSRSRTRSGSKNRPRRSRSRSTRRSRTKTYSSRRSYSRTKSESDSSESSSISSITETSVELVERQPESVDSKKIPSKDEMAFFKELRCLREVHEMQCAKYREKPQTHPNYKTEKERFMNRQSAKLPLEFKLPKWDEYWKKRMESILEQNWNMKKDLLTANLNKKNAFTPLGGGYPLNEEGKEFLTSSPHLDDRHQFRKENVETINSYLKEVESSPLSLSSSIFQSSSKDGESKDFKLSDIFKDVTGNPRNEIKDDKVSSPTKVFENFASRGTTNNTLHDSQRDHSDNNSSDNNSVCSMVSDLDVDELIENEDFLMGLDEIDKELQNAVPVEDKTTPNTEVVPSTSTSTQSASLSDFAFTDNNSQTALPSSEDDLKSEFVNVLKMLFRVSKRLGPLGLSISALFHRASEDLKNADGTFPSLNSDSKSLLMLADKKLSHLLEDDLPQVQKAIYGEITERLGNLLTKMKVEERGDTFPKVNVQSIATATVGQQLGDVVAFIKNTLLYHGYSNFKTDDIMNLYMSVKATQLDMEKT